MRCRTALAIRAAWNIRIAVHNAIRSICAMTATMNKFATP